MKYGLVSGCFAPPIFTSMILLFLHSRNVFQFEDFGMPYVVFVVCAMVFWQTFVEALRAPLQMVINSKAVLLGVIVLTLCGTTIGIVLTPLIEFFWVLAVTVVMLFVARELIRVSMPHVISSVSASRTP